jgi:hypothetical protein
MQFFSALSFTLACFASTLAAPAIVLPAEGAHIAPGSAFDFEYFSIANYAYTVSAAITFVAFLFAVGALINYWVVHRLVVHITAHNLRAIDQLCGCTSIWTLRQPQLSREYVVFTPCSARNGTQ